MKLSLIVYLGLSSLIFAFIAYATFNPIPALEKIDKAGILFIPGFFLASLVFWTGAHSDYAQAWLWLGNLLNALFWALPPFVLVNYLRKTISRQRPKE